MVHAIGLFGETSLGSRNTLSNGWAVRHTGMIGHISPVTPDKISFLSIGKVTI